MEADGRFEILSNVDAKQMGTVDCTHDPAVSASNLFFTDPAPGQLK